MKICFVRLKYFIRQIFSGKSIKESWSRTLFYGIKPIVYDELVREREAQVPHPTDLEYQPLVSIIIPVYNIEDKFLRPCLDSCLEQTYKNIEVCVSDDNSSLESVKTTLSEYEEKYDNFHVFWRKENGRISENTNSALSIAKGEFIALVDDDDTLEPYSILEMVRYINEHRDTDGLLPESDS